jgi:hypothetical protein
VIQYCGLIAARQAQIAKMQAENKWVVAGDVLFPEDGYQLRLCPIRKSPGSAR